MDPPSFLFFAAGACLIAHFAFSAILQQRLRGRDDAFREFFAIPNEPLTRGGNVEIRLLRARYYLPWMKPKAEIFRLDAMDRTILAAAQWTGLAVPIASLTFFMMSFAQAT